MKQIISCILLLAVVSVQAQRPQGGAPDKNAFLNQSFWQASPDVAAVKAEIEKGSDPTEMNRNSMDAVVIAINAQAPIESIKYLLSFKANDPNRLTHDGRTYLFWAATRGNTDLMEFLISKGAKVDIEDSHGYTALNFAASAGQRNTKVYDICIAAGADLKKELTHEGANALLLAVAQDKDLLLTNYFISKGLSINSTDKAGNTAFNYVARTGNIELMNTLIAKGVKYNDNAILMACQGGGGRGGGPAIGVEVFQYLEGLKLKPTVVNENGENALHFIVRKPNQAAVIDYFISKGVDLNKADNEGNTPFMNAAAGNRDLPTITLLIPSVKNIDQVNKKGLSALTMAVRSNSAEVVGLLIEKGANIQVKDTKGDNLAAYLLQSYNPRGAGDFDAKIKVLTDKGFDITTPQGNGNTLYHLAIAKDDIALLKRIETLKVDVNAKNKEGLTVLHKAAMTAKSDVIMKYLISIGASKDLVTDMKETPFDLAKENEYLAKNKISVEFLK